MIVTADGNNDDKGGVIDGCKKWFIDGNNECWLVIFRKDVCC